jgi:geranylgeranyl diphosphate synthase type II
MALRSRRQGSGGRSGRTAHPAGFGLPAPLASRRRAFERYLTAALPAARVRPASLHSALRYSALSPGKRFRPLLVLAACEAAGGDWRRALPAAAAIECVHAFSLVHDDLPALDDDDYRRGRPTTHKVYGEALGLLAGDALLAAAFLELTRLDGRGLSAARVVAAVRVLARAAGSRELIGGQVLDLEAERRPVTARGVREIHVRKTGALLGAALALGAIVAGATPVRVARLERVGRDLGLAFQIHDDLLNRGSSLARLGKRAGTDEARGKATYPRAVGEARARATAERLFARCLAAARAMGPRAHALEELLRVAARRET